MPKNRRHLSQYFSNHATTFLSLLFAAAIGGLISPFSKLALATLSPLPFVFIRLSFTALCLFVVIYNSQRRITWQKMTRLFPLTVFFWGNILVYAFGLSRTEASTAQFIHISIPLFTAFIAFSLKIERITPKQWGSSLIAVAGVVLIVFSEGALAFGSNQLFGNLLVLSSALLYAFFAVISRKNFSTYDPLEIVFVSCLYGAAVVFLPTILQIRASNWQRAFPLKTIFSLIIVVAATSFIYSAIQIVIKKMGPSQATTILYMISVFAMLWAALFLGEQLTVQKSIGAGLALAGVHLFDRYKQ